VWLALSLKLSIEKGNDMKRIYTFTFIEENIDVESDGTVDNAIAAIENGNLDFDSLVGLAEGTDFFTMTVSVKDVE
jgi:hypothetical protein